MRIVNRTEGRVAGIDLGTVRIGIAVSDARRSIASPYENYTRGDSQADSQRFQRLVREEDITLFVIGLPIHLSGSESKKSTEARRFGEWLLETTGIPVRYHDERMTSAQAETLLQSAELTSKKRKKRKDMLAAQLILSSFLESNQDATYDPGPLEDH